MGSNINSQLLRSTLKKRFSLICLLFIIFFYFFQGHQQARWRENRVIINDVSIYYSYLPATFIKNDPLWGFYEENKDEFNANGQYWAFQSPKGGYVPKMSMGKAFMDLPFFLIADFYAKDFGNSPRDGFSRPYQYMMMWSTLLYCVVGFVFLRLWLRSFFDEPTVGITLLAIALGTNLYHYGAHEVGMTHPHNFFLLSAALYYFPKWRISHSLKLSLIMGVVIGLLVLIRPINILLIIPIILLQKPPGVQLFAYLSSLLTMRQTWISLLTAFMIWLPQLLFWKIQSGDWFYYSYSDEGFFWLKPHVLEGLFSFRKGWFIYTPMMIMSVLGLILLYKKNTNQFWVILSFLVLFLYVTFSWWCWWYGGGFGARTLIDILPIMALPLASIFEWVLQKKLRWSLFLIPAFFIYLNYYQTWQYRNGFIHFDSMTFSGYKTVFLLDHTPAGYWEQLQTPDYANSLKYGEEREVLPLE